MTDSRLPEGTMPLELRAIEDGDAPWLAGAWASGELRPLLGDARPTDVEEVRRLIRQRRDNGEHDLVLLLGGRRAGRASIQHVDGRKGELEIELHDPGDRRRGIGRAVLLMLIDDAFGRLGLDRLEARILASNVPSLGLARELGFVLASRTTQPQGVVCTMALRRRGVS